MKAVLISIQPKWVCKILSNEKTVEVRKTAPKIPTPFKCYIYMTSTHTKISISKDNYAEEIKVAKKLSGSCGKVIGEFICDKVYNIKPYFDNSVLTQYLCGWKHGKEFDCLSFAELNSYLNAKDGYGWHISDLKIYDKPKEISKFWTVGGDKMGAIQRPPQSWFYVEELSIGE